MKRVFPGKDPFFSGFDTFRYTPYNKAVKVRNLNLVVTVEWSEKEKLIAQKAFALAYEREIRSIMVTVRQQSESITELDDVWRLHDYLSSKRYEIDGKYDFRDSALVFVFADLVKSGLLSVDELAGLESSKLVKISALTRM